MSSSEDPMSDDLPACSIHLTINNTTGDPNCRDCLRKRIEQLERRQTKALAIIRESVDTIASLDDIEEALTDE